MPAWYSHDVYTCAFDTRQLDVYKGLSGFFMSENLSYNEAVDILERASSAPRENGMRIDKYLTDKSLELWVQSDNIDKTEKFDT